ncbi:CMP/dCMP deaminase, zinc-binding [Caulobacter phage Cr30]|uniref:dCMP deaminase n=1 Tax=Caulobacter phage Cr30 TaxID=1357714 RepID=UPI0004A9B69E|nr:dCMP deaminase [Caulobacter phage Cr30]AGS80928.1 CMP/dCMP deaminase, zinc-binding [Caulobacter phage Cr30]
MKSNRIKFYMDIAERTAQESKARRLQVGSVVVKDDQIIATGCNGTFPGHDNNCEHEQWDRSKEELILTTKKEVYHSEENAILRIARSTESALGSAMFTTHSCCLNCAKMIAGSGISEFYYKNKYRDDSGIAFLNSAGVKVCQVDEEGKILDGRME